jgi:HSP20 family protein
MALDRWDPLREMMTLREAMDRLFQESVVRPTGSFLAGARGATPVDIAERDNSFVVQAAMPGIAPEDIQVTVKGNTLTIRGEHKDEEERSDQNWLVRERRGQSFYRSVTLPTAVNADKAEAKYENGVLTLTLPKADEALPKLIRIGGQVGGETGQPAIQMPGRTDQGVAAGTGGETSTSGGQFSGSQSSMTGSATGSAAGETQQDDVSRASEQSFPASDPPSWTPERS